MPLFAGLPPAQLKAVADMAVPRSFRRRELVFRQDDAADGLYLVETGRVKVFLAQEDGEEVIVGLLGLGDHFGEMALIDAEPRSTGAMAYQDNDLRVIPKRAFRQLLRASNELAQSLFKGLSERLRSANGMIESLATQNVTGRVVRILLHYAELEDGRLVVIEPLTQQEIVHMVGVSREMVNRTLQDLVRRGLIERDADRIVLSGLPYVLY